MILNNEDSTESAALTESADVAKKPHDKGWPKPRRSGQKAQSVLKRTVSGKPRQSSATKPAASASSKQVTVPVQLTRLGREMKLLVRDTSDSREPDASLLRIIARAHDVQRRLTQDTALTVHDIAREEHVTSDYLYIVLRLCRLALDIITAIVNGRQPPELNAKRLMRLIAQLPADWSKQKVLLGFR